MTIKPVNRTTRFLALLCLLALVLAGCSSSPATVTAPPLPTLTTSLETRSTDSRVTPQSVAPTTAARADWPTDEWSTSSPEAQGMDSQKLAEMLAAIDQQHLNLHSLLIIRNGYLVSETYFGSYQPDTRHELYSCHQELHCHAHRHRAG